MSTAHPTFAIRCRGAGLVEACVALALVAVAASAMFSSVAPLGCALRVDAARSALVAALVEARRRAYALETDVDVEVAEGAGEVVVRPPGSARSLGERVRVVAGPGDGAIGFRATGLADNATVRVACGNSAAAVVVNQRGAIR